MWTKGCGEGFGSILGFGFMSPWLDTEMGRIIQVSTDAGTCTGVRINASLCGQLDGEKVSGEYT